MLAGNLPNSEPITTGGAQAKLTGRGRHACLIKGGDYAISVIACTHVQNIRGGPCILIHASRVVCTLHWVKCLGRYM